MMKGIPISGASYVYGYNMLVIHTTSKPESTLKKKCNAIAYHAVHESMTMKESLKWHIMSENNQADLIIKVITGHKQKHLVSLVLYDI